MTNFIDTADSRETSVEIMEAILKVAGVYEDSEDAAEHIWSDPNTWELVAIIEIVTNNGMISTEDFFWGEFGNKWAE